MAGKLFSPRQASTGLEQVEKNLFRTHVTKGVFKTHGARLPSFSSKKWQVQSPSVSFRTHAAWLSKKWQVQSPSVSIRKHRAQLSLSFKKHRVQWKRWVKPSFLAFKRCRVHLPSLLFKKHRVKLSSLFFKKPRVRLPSRSFRKRWTQQTSFLFKKHRVKSYGDDKMQSFRLVTLESTKKRPMDSSFDGTALPSYLSKVNFPAGDVAGYKAPRGGLWYERTEEDRRNVETVLTTSIRIMAAYVTPKMIDTIKKSPYFKRDENEVVFSSHRHRTRGRNVQYCYKILSRFTGNIFSEIVYRRQRIAADERMYREDGAAHDPE